jgi:hypothetical protein
MSRGSAFARVIGITRSLSPLSFDRTHKGEGADEAFADLPPGAADDSPALPPAQIDTSLGAVQPADDTGDVFHAVEMAVEEESAKPASATITTFPAQSKVTVVSNAPAPVAAEAQPEALADASSAEIPGDMIEAIESDMASLLASLNRLDDGPPAEATAEAADGEWREDETEEEPTLALLSELNRMWQADPEIVAGRV